MKNTTKRFEKALTWIGDLLYENNVHQRDTHVYDRAENELIVHLKEAELIGARMYRDAVKSGNDGGYTNKEVLFISKVNSDQ